MKFIKFARIAALTLIVSAAALTSFANPPLRDCSCGYCSHTANTKECINFDGTTVTCGYFLAVTLCQA